MIKEYKKTLIIGSLIILLPILIGVLKYDDLPSSVATHFNSKGNANGWSSKPFTVFGLPLFLLALHWLCTVFTVKDPKKKNINKKMINVVFWIVPAVSIICFVTIYGNALGYNIDSQVISCLFISVLFIIIGNYLPKCKQSYTVGIKLPWTLNDEENWNKTHRLAGWVWIIGGFIFGLNTFIGNEKFLIITLVVIVLIPTIYSFILYLKKK